MRRPKPKSRVNRATHVQSDLVLLEVELGGEVLGDDRGRVKQHEALDTSQHDVLADLNRDPGRADRQHLGKRE